MILLDTSTLIDAITGPKLSGRALLRLLDTGERVALPALVVYEWLRGPRSAKEIADQEDLLPVSAAIPYEPEDAALSADIYRSIRGAGRRARSREIDIAIAACSIRHKAELWTLNPSDFADIPGLLLLRPR